MAHSPSNYAPAHARIYDKWRALPSWRCLSCAARALLIEFMCDYRPALANNGRLQMSVRRAASGLNVGKDTATAALLELEIAGWITVEKLGSFGRRNTPTEYALTMFPNDANATLASFDFERFEPMETKGWARRSSVRPQVGRGPGSFALPQDRREAKPSKYGPVQVSDALLKSPVLNGQRKANFGNEKKQ